MTNKQWDAAKEVISTIEQAGYEAVIVGGAVRDYFLQKTLNDIDIATSAFPQEVKSIFKQTVDVGIAHGTVLVLDAGEPIEVTTYRTDGDYVDHRRPQQVQFVRSLEEDLLRRDFTMNAMAMTNQLQMIDYYGGKADIQAKIIRAVGEPNLRFEEDALRMLRAARFVAQLGFSIEQQTFVAITKQAHTIQHIAVERIVMELNKLFVSEYVADGVRVLIETNLRDYLPGNWEMAAWEHFKSKQADLGWANLAYSQQGNWQEMLQQYKLSNQTKLFVKQVLEAIEAIKKGWSILHTFRFDPAIVEGAWQIYAQQFTKQLPEVTTVLLQKEQLPIQTKAELVINGRDLMTWSDQKKGPWLSEALQQAVEAVVLGQVSNEKEQLKEWFINVFNDKG